MFKLTCFLLSLFVLIHADEEVTKEEGVLVLTDDNFEKVVTENEFILVEFYAPWCGHCKALAPEYAKAAQKLAETDSKILLGKVDATQQTGLAKKYEVKGYPTLKFFKNGEPSEYGGGRTADEIINWLEKKTGPPAKTLSTVEEAKTFIKEKPVTVVGFFKNLESEEAKVFLEAASKIDDYPFAITADDSIKKEYEVTAEHSIILFKDFDDGKVVFDGKYEKEIIGEFIAGESLPLLTEFNQETASKIFGGAIKSHLLAFLSKKDGHLDQHTEALKTVAKKFKGKILFVTINTDEEDHARILEFFGMVKEEVPAFRIIKLEEDMAKYKPDSYDFSEDYLTTFVQKFLDGKLSQHLLSQTVPEDWDSKPVKVLVASKFEEVAHDTEKDVLVEFYAPWCGHCKALVPIYEELAEKFAKDSSILIAKMDSTANELKDIKIQSFPTIKLFRKGSNEVIDYNGERTLKGLTEFLGDPVANKGADAEEEEDEDESDEEEPAAKIEL